MKKITSLSLILISSLFVIPLRPVALNPLLANVISGNNGDGVLITNNSSGNVVAGNVIGTDLSGSLNLGNGGNGVAIINTSSGNTVGGTTLTAGNLIAYNQKGVVVGTDSADLSVGNTILSNSIYFNALIGIDLANDGPTPNHATNPAVGPNDFQNYPVLNSFTITNTGLSIAWTLHSVPSADFILQFFSNAIGDPEGRLLIGQVTAVTDASGNATGTVAIGGVPLNTPLTSTATIATGPGTLGDTSEFSAALIYGVATTTATICLPKPCKI